MLLPALAHPFLAYFWVPGCIRGPSVPSETPVTAAAGYEMHNAGSGLSSDLDHVPTSL